MTRVHHSDSAGAASICGSFSAWMNPLGAAFLTTNAGAVTCQRCRREILKLEAQRDLRGDHRAAVLDGPGRSDVGRLGAFAIAQSIAGEPVSTGPRWGGIASAWEALVRAQAERRLIASSSSPDRFGRRGGSSSNATPTTPRETQTDLVNIEMARDAACCAMTVGEHDLSAGQVLAIAQARVVGRVIRRAVRTITGTVIEKRGTTFEIVAVSAQEVADETGMTRHQVGIVVRRVRAEMAPRLARMGLIPSHVAAREQRSEEERQEAAMATPVGFDVEGWKEIGELVGRSPKVCQELARRPHDPLPVTKYLGRAIARKSELAAWVRMESRPASGAA